MFTAFGHAEPKPQARTFRRKTLDGNRRPRVISGTSRFVGFAVAFVASTFASPFSALAQAPHHRASAKDLFGTVPHAAVTGTVLDRGGQPQSGARVELLNSRDRVIAETYTDEDGRYRLPRLGAGMYQIEVDNALFLPTLRTDLRLLSGSRLVVNLTLSTLYEAMQWLPAQAPATNGSPDDWSWTLRLATNRPLLRMLDPAEAQKLHSSAILVENGDVPASQSHTTEVTVHSGLARFGEGGLEQGVAWSSHTGEERALLLAAQTAFAPDGSGRLESSAGYVQQLSPDRSMTTIVTVADRPSIEGADGSAGLTTMRIRSSSTIRLGDLAEIDGGTEIVAAHMNGAATAVASHPFATIRVSAHGTNFEYRAATAPTLTDAANLQAESAEDAPALSEADGRVQIEEGLHQELRLSREIARGAFGALSGEMSLFDDSMTHPVLQGAVGPAIGGGEAAVDSQNVLYDPGTGTIAVSGRGYSGGGVMALLRDQLSPDTWLSLRYAMGEALALPTAAATQSGLENIAATTTAQETPMAAVEGGTRIPHTGSVLRASYRWQPLDTLTSVTPFVWEVPDAYLGVSLRQPLHLPGGSNGRLEAIVDVRNLLAQGYRPFLSQDGTVVYFAQAQRCVAAGVRFSF